MEGFPFSLHNIMYMYIYILFSTFYAHIILYYMFIVDNIMYIINMYDSCIATIEKSET